MKLGSRACARARGIRASDLPWVPDESYRDSQNRAHRLGQRVLCALIEASRAREGHCLATWRPEHWVRTRAADVKPDGFGRYLHPGGAVSSISSTTVGRKRSARSRRSSRSKRGRLPRDSRGLRLMRTPDQGPGGTVSCARRASRRRNPGSAIVRAGLGW